MGDKLPELWALTLLNLGFLGLLKPGGGADSAPPPPLKKSVLYLWWEYETYLDYKVL